MFTHHLPSNRFGFIKVGVAAPNPGGKALGSGSRAFLVGKAARMFLAGK